MFSFKIDLDIKLSKNLMTQWIKTRKNMLIELGFTIKEVNISKSSKRGHHITFLVKGKKVQPTRANAIQFLLGDCLGRVRINAMRIERGTPWRESNKLFSKVIWRKKNKNHKCNCTIHQKILKRMKNQKQIKKLEW